MSEEQFVAWLQGLQKGDPTGLPGDDAAVLGRGRAARALTVDQQIAGTHVPADLDATVWARRLLAVNLSDLAAMGAEPVGALLTLAVPDGFPLRQFVKSAVQACKRFGLSLSGGDVSRASTAVTSMTLIGRRSAGGRWLRRSEALLGDRIWVGSTLGESALGQRLVTQGARLASNRVHLPNGDLPPALLRAARRAVRRHLAPTPQLDLGSWLARQRRGAAIDVSDGLAKDLHRLCKESGLGARISGNAIPQAPGAALLAKRLRVEPLEMALQGGEDYCLLFTLPSKTEVPQQFGASSIGEITQTGVNIVIGEETHPLPAAGFDHLT